MKFSKKILMTAIGAVAICFTLTACGTNNNTTSTSTDSTTQEHMAAPGETLVKDGSLHIEYAKNDNAYEVKLDTTSENGTDVKIDNVIVNGTLFTGFEFEETVKKGTVTFKLDDYELAGYGVNDLTSVTFDLTINGKESIKELTVLSAGKDAATKFERADFEYDQIAVDNNLAKLVVTSHRTKDKTHFANVYLVNRSNEKVTFNAEDKNWTYTLPANTCGFSQVKFESDESNPTIKFAVTDSSGSTIAEADCALK